jgi:antitoxin MazE
LISSACTRILIVDTEVTVIAKVQKWGNSLALRIPKSFAQEAQLEEETEVHLTVMNGQLVARRIPPRYDLAELLEGVRRDNLHAEIDTGPALGRELS